MLTALLQAIPGRALASAQPHGIAYRGWRVQDVEILGVQRSISNPLKDGLALAERERSLLGRLRRAVFQPELLADDVQRVRLYLATRGYPRVRVEPELIADERRHRVTVEFHVTPGERVHIADIDVVGLPDDVSLLPGTLKIAAGDPLVDAELATAQDAVLTALLAHGYSAADVRRSIEFVDDARVNLRFEVTPGAVYRVQNVEFEGASEDLRVLARRTIGIEPGEVNTPKALSEGSKRLQQLQLFRRVDFETPRVAAGQVDILCRLTESEPRTVEVGIGAWSDGIIQGRAAWSHRNLFSRGRGLGFRAIASKIEQELSVAVWQPSILGPKTRATGIVRGRLEDETAYESTKLEVEANLRFSFSVDRDHDLQTAVVYAFVDYKGNTAAVEDPAGRLLTARAHWLNDMSDHRFYPRRGYLIHPQVETSIPGSESDFLWMQLKSVYYQPLPRNAVWAFRVTPGYVQEYGNSTIPPDRLFYAGGALSMRGFKRRELGPRDLENVPIGGRVLLEFSSEVRVPTWWRLSLAAFVDAAQVWREPSDVRLGDLEVAMGPGLAFRTPIGPVRGDFGFRLTDFDETQPHWAFHFYIGNPF